MGISTMILILFFLLIPFAYADTTFFDQDDAFIMGSSTTGEVAGGTTEGTGTGGGCIHKWNCTQWSECLSSGKQTRNCINIGTCSNTYNYPEIEQNCMYTAPLKADENENVVEKENIIEKDENKEEKGAEISEDEPEQTQENPLTKSNYIFYIITLIAVLILRWIYYHWKEN